MVGLEHCESLFTDLSTRKVVADKNSARRFLSIQLALGQGELLGTENPAVPPPPFCGDWNPAGPIEVLRCV